MLTTYVGPKPGDLAHAEGGKVVDVLLGRGWRPLAKLDAKAIRALCPAGTKLPPRARPETLAPLVTAALLAGGKARWPRPQPQKTAIADEAVFRRPVAEPEE